MILRKKYNKGVVLFSQSDYDASPFSRPDRHEDNSLLPASPAHTEAAHAQAVPIDFW